AHPLAQPRPGRRLDRHRLSRHHRIGGALRGGRRRRPGRQLIVSPARISRGLQRRVCLSSIHANPPTPRRSGRPGTLREVAGIRHPHHKALPPERQMTSSTVARDRESAPAPLAAPLPDLDAVDALVGEMRGALKSMQRPDGHWLFELEADATIPSEYIFLQHFLGRIDTPRYREIEPKIANHL